MTTELQGCTALVTGSSAGIGAAIAHAYAAAGAHVAVTGRNVERIEGVVAAITAAGGTAVAVRAGDLVDPAAVYRLADDALTALGHIDILVNNAAMLLMPAPTADVPAETVTAAFATSVVAPYLLVGRLAPAMAERGDGAIVNIGSITGLIGSAGSALYNATKATLHSLTRSWAAEYGPAGVRVNTLAPGPTTTERNRAIAEHLAPLLERIPSGRMSSEDEIAAAALFLAGAGNVHGALLSVDGGWAAV